ncbi:MAG: MmgE/PrpD family protein [Reyranellaceae bacterium]
MAEDSIQTSIVDFALGLSLADLSPADLRAARIHTIDTFASLIAGFSSPTSAISRRLAERLGGEGSSIIGTHARCAPDTAAFVNGTTAREIELNDVYFSTAGAGAHPSDVLMPILAAAEYARASGRAFMAAVLAAYEVYVAMSDRARITGFDQSTLAGIATAVGAGKLLGLDRKQMMNCLAIVTVANNPLNQTRRNDLSMWKAAAAGQAGRAGVFAALAAAAGLEGPSLPFEGAQGWCKHVAQEPFELDGLGGSRLRIHDVMMKPRAACAATISSILAAEKVAAGIGGPSNVASIVVTTYEDARRLVGSSPQHWNPTTRETADHSIPYVVAAALADGTVGPRQFDDEHLVDPVIRGLMTKVSIAVDDTYSAAYAARPPRHYTSVTVNTADGRQVTGLAGGEQGDMAMARSDAEVEQKFVTIVEDFLGARRTRRALDQLWKLDEIDDVNGIAPLFARDAVQGREESACVV